MKATELQSNKFRAITGNVASLLELAALEMRACQKTNYEGVELDYMFDPLKALFTYLAEADTITRKSMEEVDGHWTTYVFTENS